MLVTRLPFDPAVVEAQVRAEAVTEDAESPVGQALRQGWPLIEQMARTAKAA
jgi:hypothetical protein